MKNNIFKLQHFSTNGTSCRSQLYRSTVNVFTLYTCTCFAKSFSTQKFEKKNTLILLYVKIIYTLRNNETVVQTAIMRLYPANLIICRFANSLYKRCALSFLDIYKISGTKPKSKKLLSNQCIYLNYLYHCTIYSTIYYMYPIHLLVLKIKYPKMIHKNIT